MMEAARSPCINFCRMDEDSGLCAGCLRTIDEIVAWAGADEGQKHAILAAVEKRRGRFEIPVGGSRSVSGDD